MNQLSKYDKGLRRPSVETDLDIILNHMMDTSGTTKLDDRLQRMHDRIDFAYEQLRLRLQDADIAKMIEKRFSVSRSTAYADIRNAKMLFGELGPVNMIYEIRELLQLSILNIRMAIDSKNVKDFTKAIEARTNILKLHKERDDIDWSKIEPNAYYLMINVPDGAYKLDLDNLEKISKTQTKEIFNQMMESFDAEIVEIISEDVTPTGQATSTQQGTADNSSAPGEH